VKSLTFPYGVGFRSLERETRAPVTLRVEGKLPSWLEGTLLRTGPSKYEVGDRTYNHWFDGLAMLHRFAFSNGAVTYASRFLEGDAFRGAQATGKISYAEFATDPCRTLFGRVAAWFDPKLTDNCCVNVMDYGRKTVAFTETTLPMRFDPDTLATLGVFAYAKALSGQVSTAHAHYDASRKRHYNYVVAFGLHSLYRLIAMTDSGDQEVVAEIPVDRPSYMHSFGMTERHLILVEYPIVVSALELKFSGKPFIRNYRWLPERGLKFHVIEKDSGKVTATTHKDACFSFHHVNAYEDGNNLAIDLIAYEDSSIIDQLYLARLRAGTPITATGTLTRFRVPLNGGTGTREILAPASIELPRINYETRAGKPYRYVWGTGVETEGDFLDSIVKIDLDSRTLARWYEKDHYPGEPVFVPAPGAKVEDEGVLLSIVLDIDKDRSSLLVLDATNLKELARAEAPHTIPFHFHGNYFASTPGPSTLVS
jgi:carotenoid cleavage dioxygenase-like enzyme